MSGAMACVCGSKEVVPRVHMLVLVEDEFFCSHFLCADCMSFHGGGNYVITDRR